MLSFITSGAGKLLGIIALIASLYGAAKSWEYEHDKRVLAEVSVKEQALVAATLKADNDRLVIALQDRDSAAMKLAASQRTIRDAINHAKVSATCVRSAPIAAAIDGLRSGSGSN